jgi:hypothetical protein
MTLWRGDSGETFWRNDRQGIDREELEGETCCGQADRRHWGDILGIGRQVITSRCAGDGQRRDR